MFKLIIKIFILLLISGIVGVSIFMYLMTDENKEVLELKNDINGENIYLIKTSWGFDDSKMAIGLNKRLKTGFNNTPKDKYTETVSTEYIFYKLERGKLIIYNNNFIAPQNNKFKTEIEFVSLSNSDFYKLSENKNYLKQGLKIFPVSVIGRLNYSDSLKDKKNAHNTMRSHTRLSTSAFYTSVCGYKNPVT